MQNMKLTYHTLLELAAEMVLDEAVSKFRIYKIYDEIDVALAQGDAVSFQRLTDELKKIQK